MIKFGFYMGANNVNFAQENPTVHLYNWEIQIRQLLFNNKDVKIFAALNPVVDLQILLMEKKKNSQILKIKKKMKLFPVTPPPKKILKNCFY